MATIIVKVVGTVAAHFLLKRDDSDQMVSQSYQVIAGLYQIRLLLQFIISINKKQKTKNTHKTKKVSSQCLEFKRHSKCLLRQ